MIQIRRKVPLETVSLALMLLTQCSMWFFEDIFSLHPLAVVLSAGAFVLLLVKKKVQLAPGGWIFLLYLLGIYLSMAISGGDTRTLYRFLLTAMLLIYINFADGSMGSLTFLTGALTAVGVFAAVCVMAQFVFRDLLTLPFYSLLAEGPREEALFYYQRGYYSGVIIKPHEAAGLIAFAMVCLILGQCMRGKPWWALLPLTMALPLLLTGKRAIFVFVFLSLVLIYAAALVLERRYKRLVGICLLLAALLAVGLTLIRLFPENPLFARFAKLLEGDGGLIDDTRTRLWGDAVELWMEKPLFGVGWQNFPSLAMERFRYERSHAVNLDYLQFLCETGVVGFVLMMTPIVIMFLRGWRLFRYAVGGEMTWRQKQMIWLAMYIQVFTLLYAFIEVPFYSGLFFAVYIFSCIIINRFFFRIPQLRGKKISIRFQKLAEDTP